jgi:hypothetical protein
MSGDVAMDRHGIRLLWLCRLRSPAWSACWTGCTICADQPVTRGPWSQPSPQAMSPLRPGRSLCAPAATAARAGGWSSSGPGDVHPCLRPGDRRPCSEELPSVLDPLLDRTGEVTGWFGRSEVQRCRASNSRRDDRSPKDRNGIADVSTGVSSRASRVRSDSRWSPHAEDRDGCRACSLAGA